MQNTTKPTKNAHFEQVLWNPFFGTSRFTKETDETNLMFFKHLMRECFSDFDFVCRFNAEFHHADSIKVSNWWDKTSAWQFKKILKQNVKNHTLDISVKKNLTILRFSYNVEGCDQTRKLTVLYRANDEIELYHSLPEEKGLIEIKVHEFVEWMRIALKFYGDASITYEDGSNKTYGDLGSWTVHTGPDMQADVVATYGKSRVVFVNSELQFIIGMLSCICDTGLQKFLHVTDKAFQPGSVWVSANGSKVKIEKVEPYSGSDENPSPDGNQNPSETQRGDLTSYSVYYEPIHSTAEYDSVIRESNAWDFQVRYTPEQH